MERSHLDNDDEDAMLSDNWEFVFADFDGWVILKVSSRGYCLHPYLYPESKVDALKEKLPDCDILPSSAAYSYVGVANDGRIEPFWKEEDGFADSEIPIYFDRHYDGRKKGKESYVEFSQVVTHRLDLHWSSEKESYCKLNDLGEEIEIIKLIKANGVELILIRRRTLDELLYLGKWNLVRYFNFTRMRGEYPPSGSTEAGVFESQKLKIKFKMWVYGNQYVEFRGAQIEQPVSPKEKVIAWGFSEEEEDDKKFGNFIVNDWKNKHILFDYSIDPANFANYFIESDLPFETSSIFFKAEVLDKYKNNPDKYKLSERSITCRGAWHLETFDVNKYNQVHTYAVYLARLPYKEQLHWLQYNEKPKGPISKRAFKSDFEGSWDYERSKMQELKTALENLSEITLSNNIVIWKPKGDSWETAFRGLHLVITENPNQWHDFIIALANATNEGFQTKSLRKIADYFGNRNEKLRTLGLIKAILESTSNENAIEDTYGVLNDIQIKRGGGKAHGNGVTPEGSLIEDAQNRLEKATKAIKLLTEFFKSLSIEIKP